MKYRMNSLIKLSLYVTLLLILTVNASAQDDSTCSGIGAKGDEIQVEKVTYLTDTPRGFDSRATGDKIELKGLLYYYRDNKKANALIENRSVLIYNHGHDIARQEPCAIATFFTKQGWIVFAPLRRGHFLDPNKNDKRETGEMRSTGIHIDDYTDKCMRSQELALTDKPELYCLSKKQCRPDVPCGMNFKRNAVELGYLSEQREDVREQIKFIKLRPAIGLGAKGKLLADPNRVTVLGHSYGGSLIVFSNQNDFGQSAMIDVSGAELSWGKDEPYWQLDLVNAMHAQKRPIYFLQPENGITLEPTNVLSSIAEQRKLVFKKKIFPPAPCSKFTTNKNGKKVCDESDSSAERQAHGTFVTEDEQVELWGPTVVAFSDQHARGGAKQTQAGGGGKRRRS